MRRASEVRRRAVQRLIDIAGRSYDVELTIARGSIDVLVRQALTAAAGDQALIDEIKQTLWPEAGASRQTIATVDATHHDGPAHGSPSPEAGPSPRSATVAELEDLMQEVLHP